MPHGFIKQVVGSKGETTPRSDGKRSKESSPNEEAQKDWPIISMDSPDQASNDQSVLEGPPNEAGAPLEEGVLTGGPSHVDEIGEEGPSGVVAASMLRPKPTDTEPSKKRQPDLVMLSTYVPPQERIHPLMGMAAGDAKVRVEDNLTRALNALAVEKEDGRRLEAGVAYLSVKRTSLLL